MLFRCSFCRFDGDKGNVFFRKLQTFCHFLSENIEKFKNFMYLKCETAGVLAVVLLFQIECNMVAGETVVG